MANYGKNRYYVIDQVIFNQSIDDIILGSGKDKIKLQKYYNDKYGIDIINKKQPLIRAELTKRQKKKRR